MIDAAAVPAGRLVVCAGRCHRSSGWPKSCCGIPRIPRAPLTIQNRARRHYSCLADGKQVLMRSDVASHVINALRGGVAGHGACTDGPPKRSRDALYGVLAPNGYGWFHGRTVHSVSC